MGAGRGKGRRAQAVAQAMASGAALPDTNALVSQQQEIVQQLLDTATTQETRDFRRLGLLADDLGKPWAEAIYSRAWSVDNLLELSLSSPNDDVVGLAEQFIGLEGLKSIAFLSETGSSKLAGSTSSVHPLILKRVRGQYERGEAVDNVASWIYKARLAQTIECLEELADRDGPYREELGELLRFAFRERLAEEDGLDFRGGGRGVLRELCCLEAVGVALSGHGGGVQEMARLGSEAQSLVKGFTGCDSTAMTVMLPYQGVKGSWMELLSPDSPAGLYRSRQNVVFTPEYDREHPGHTLVHEHVHASFGVVGGDKRLVEGAVDLAAARILEEDDSKHLFGYGHWVDVVRTIAERSTQDEQVLLCALARGDTTGITNELGLNDVREMSKIVDVLDGCETREEMRLKYKGIIGR